jgi:hypothetical protein
MRRDRRCFMKTRTSLLLAAMLLFAALAPARAQRVFHHGVLLHDHTAATFTVNGFPFRPVAATEQPLTTIDLTSYLMQGSNRLKWTFSGQPTATDPALFRFRLEKKTENVAGASNVFTIERALEFQQEGEAPNVATFFSERLLVQPTTDFRHELRARLTPGKASRFFVDLSAPESRISPLPAEPAELTVVATLADLPLANLPWQGASIALTDEDREEIRALVTAFHAAFVGKDTDALTSLQTARIQRFATARAQTEAEFASSLIESYSPIFSAPAFVFEPLNAAQLTFASAPEANLVQVEKGGEPPIKATGQVQGQNATFKVPVYVSKLGGVWKIVD